jgi:hypothetical protein
MWRRGASTTAAARHRDAQPGYRYGDRRWLRRLGADPEVWDRPPVLRAVPLRARGRFDGFINVSRALQS